MKEIIKILQNYKLVKREFYLTLLLRGWVSAIALYMPFLIKDIYTIIEKKGPLNDMYFLIGVLAALTIILWLISLSSQMYQIKLWLNLYVKKHLLYRRNIVNKNYDVIAQLGTWKLLTRLESWVFSEVDIFSRLLKIFTEVIIMWSITVIIITVVLPKFMYIIIGSIILISVSIYFLKKYIKKYYKLEQEWWEVDWRNRGKIVMEFFTIKLYWKLDYELFNTKKVLNQTAWYWVKADIANEVFYKIVEIIIRFGEVFILFTVWTLIITTWEYNLSYLAMLIYYMALLWYPMDEAISHINTINKSWEKYKKLSSFIEMPNTIINWKEKFIYKNGSIEFKQLNFWYSKKVQIFKNLNLEFLSWKKNALVWHSGGWKSTITKLLLRLYDTSFGEILLDWQEIKTLDINTFYSKIWYLPQEPAVFDGTIRENMEYAFETPPITPPLSGEGDNKEKKIWKALKKARIDDMVKKLEHWLDTEVWEKWIKLSWWEKQRLAIARIFLKNPEIIILDEPTSALDSISEAKITKSLEELTSWKTSIVIAHRLQTVMNADKIIVIEDGKIEAEWNHKELIQNSSIYKKLVDLQNGKIVE